MHHSIQATYAVDHHCGPIRSNGDGIYVSIYIFAVVDFDALVQASTFQIERRQVVFCWKQDSKLVGLETPNHQESVCPLTNWLSYQGSSSKTWTQFNSPSLWWVNIQHNWLHCQLAFAPGSGVYMFIVKLDALALERDFLNRKETSRLPLLKAGFEARRSAADWMPTHHDDVIKWKHFPCYWPFVQAIHRSPVNSPHKGQWRGAFMFSLI